MAQFIPLGLQQIIKYSSDKQCEGWEDFDKRRRAKHQKQIDFRVMNSAEFDEGADKN